LRPEIFMQNLFGYGGVRVVENALSATMLAMLA
jgi:hypothetical protein